jgi:hypothetical protein
MSMSMVLIAKTAKASNYTTVHVDDVVCVTWDNGSVMVAQVLVLCSIDNLILAGIRCWPMTPHHNMYSTTGPVCLVRAHDIIDVCIYKVDEHTSVAFVVPLVLFLCESNSRSSCIRVFYKTRARELYKRQTNGVKRQMS